MSEICSIIQEIGELSSKNKAVIFNLLSAGIDIKDLPTAENYLKDFRYNDNIVCPYCGSIGVVKNGKRKDGTQKYCCKDCSHHFVLTTNSILSHTRKDFSVWVRFINCMVEDMSLEHTASICGIHKNTAFMWRHKILEAYANENLETMLDGVIQMDETYFRASYKGNHTNSKTFVMPREAYERGHHSKADKANKHTVRKRGLSSEQVCVPCAITPTGLTVSKVCKLGAASALGLEKVFENHIDKEAYIVSDSYNAYPSFAAKMKANLIQIEPDKYTSGIYNIQRVNSFHSSMKKLLNYKFNGVSTKYLNNYIELCRINTLAKSLRETKLNIVLNLINSVFKTFRIHDITLKENLPVII